MAIHLLKLLPSGKYSHVQFQIDLEKMLGVVYRGVLISAQGQTYSMCIPVSAMHQDLAVQGPTLHGGRTYWRDLCFSVPNMVWF